MPASRAVGDRSAVRPPPMGKGGYLKDGITAAGTLRRGGSAAFSCRKERQVFIAPNSMDNSEKTKLKQQKRWRFLLRTAGNFFIRRFNYSYEDLAIEPPFLLISNHVTNSDPFLVGITSRTAPLTYVASEHIFRLGPVTKLIRAFAEMIPRSKAASGLGTVKTILQRARKGEGVVLFAEGDCTWDGVSHHVMSATGKLAKAAKVPLVTFRLKGGYLTSPRWAKKLRKARMHGGAVHIYTPEELSGMTAEEVTAAIDRDIYDDTWADQLQERIRVRSSAPAECLERALFICPVCGGIDCMGSKGGTLFCKNCGTGAELDEYGFFREGAPFRTVREWDEWQRSALAEKRGAGLFAGRGVLTGVLGEKLKKKTAFSLDLDRGGIVIGDEFTPFSAITDMAMVKTVRLLFSTEKGYYELKSKRGILRPYLTAWQLQRKDTEEG